MSVVGQRLSEPTPTDHAARPVASACGFVGHECLVADRLRSFPVAFAVAVIGNARVCAAAGARQNEQSLMAFDKGLECGSHAGKHLVSPRPGCQRAIAELRVHPPSAVQDRITDFYSVGCRFESCWDRQYNQQLRSFFSIVFMSRRVATVLALFQMSCAQSR